MLLYLYVHPFYPPNLIFTWLGWPWVMTFVSFCSSFSFFSNPTEFGNRKHPVYCSYLVAHPSPAVRATSCGQCRIHHFIGPLFRLKPQMGYTCGVRGPSSFLVRGFFHRSRRGRCGSQKIYDYTDVCANLSQGFTHTV